MTKHTRLLVANWKSHKTSAEAQTWLETFRRRVTDLGPQLNSTGKPTMVVAPPFPFVPQTVAALVDVPHVSVAVQDISPFPAGKYTGAVSTRNLEGWPISHAIVGHSERRRYFHETNQEVANKVSVLIEAGITPIVCVDAEYVEQQADVIEKQLRSRCVVAYEPLAAIGTGVSQEVAEVLPVVDRVREAFGAQTAVIYGGSVTVDNLDAYLLATDGVLVGGASLDADEFMNLVEKAVSP